MSNKEGNFSCKLGVLSRPDGSVLLTQCETTVLAAVYGPIEVRNQNMLIDKAKVEACYRPKAGIPGIGDRLYENIIQNICQTALAAVLYPRSSILVIIQEMENSGSIISCAVNASCLALLSSGIDMKSMVAGVSCAMDSSNELHINPPKLLLEKAVATFVFVFDSVGLNIVASHTTGSFNLDHYKSALEICKKESELIFTLYKSIIVEKLS